MVRGRRIERLSLGCRPRVLPLYEPRMVRVGRLELPFRASEARALSVELRALKTGQPVQT